jgi:hypothetical protein
MKGPNTLRLLSRLSNGGMFLFRISVQANHLKKIESARVSIPPQLIEEEDPKHSGKKRFAWKIDLRKTEKFWLGILWLNCRLVQGSIFLLPEHSHP